MIAGQARCIGDSMLPTIKSYDKITFAAVEEYKIGDIILFKSKTNFFREYAHRIVNMRYDKKGTFFTAKGDNRNISREYETNVPIKNIIAKVLTTKNVKEFVCGCDNCDAILVDEKECKKHRKEATHYINYLYYLYMKPYYRFRISYYNPLNWPEFIKAVLDGGRAGGI